MAEVKPAEISAILRKQLSGFTSEESLEEVGTILQVGDGIARAYGLSNAESGELVEFEGGQRGIVLNLEEDNVGIVLLSNSTDIKEGSSVKRTGQISSINVGEGFTGRVVNTLGQPIDGKGEIEGELLAMPLERKAPGVIYRQPVNEPLQTGIKAIDSMIPIGRGQRELIIGDRQTVRPPWLSIPSSTKRSFTTKVSLFTVYTWPSARRVLPLHKSRKHWKIRERSPIPQL
jgi:F-type H+-transporting ATPase subunit alpha